MCFRVSKVEIIKIFQIIGLGGILITKKYSRFTMSVWCCQIIEFKVLQVFQGYVVKQ